MIATQVKRRMNKGMRRVDRSEYAQVERHPVRLVSWATDPANIGGLCRSSEAYLVDQMFGIKAPARATSVGTDRWQPLSHGWDLAQAVIDAKDDGYTIVALEQTDASTPLEQTVLPEKMCLLIGNEGSGLPKSAIAAADMAVEITQFGFVGSLNVVVATGIALYEWSRQHAQEG